MWPLWPLTFDRVTPNSIFSYLIIKPTLWMWWKFANPFSVMHCFMTLCYVTLDFWPPENTLVFLTSLWTYPTWWKSKHQFSNYRQIKLAIVTFDFWTHFLHYQPPPPKKKNHFKTPIFQSFDHTVINQVINSQMIERLSLVNGLYYHCDLWILTHDQEMKSLSFLLWTFPVTFLKSQSSVRKIVMLILG